MFYSETGGHVLTSDFDTSKIGVMRTRDWKMRRDTMAMIGNRPIGATVKDRLVGATVKDRPIDATVEDRSIDLWSSASPDPKGGSPPRPTPEAWDWTCPTPPKEDLRLVRP